RLRALRLRPPRPPRRPADRRPRTRRSPRARRRRPVRAADRPREAVAHRPLPRHRAGRLMRRALAALYRSLGDRGLNAGTAGNVSARTKRGMLITPSGRTADEITPRSLVKTTLDGTYTGRPAPSS